VGVLPIKTKEELLSIIYEKRTKILSEIEVDACIRGFSCHRNEDFSIDVSGVNVAARPMYASDCPYRDEAGRISVSVHGFWKPGSLTRAIRTKAFTEPFDQDKRISVSKILDRVQDVITCREQYKIPFDEIDVLCTERAALEAALLRACRHVSYCGTECPRTGGECIRPEELDEEGRCGACGFDCPVDFVAECWRIEFMKPGDGDNSNG